MSYLKSFINTTVYCNSLADNRSFAMYFGMMEEALADDKARILEGSYFPDYTIP